MANWNSELRNVKELAALYRCRPAFARMVSWEIGREDYVNPALRKKKGRKGLRGSRSDSDEKEGTEGDRDDLPLDEIGDGDDLPVDEIGSDSSNSSVYYSAEESSADGTEADRSNLASEASRPNSTSANGADIGRKRRLSKRQRQLKRDRFKVEYLDHAIPFKNADILQTDRPYDTVQETCTQIIREVPCLVELCLRCIHGKQSAVGEKSKDQENQLKFEIPPGLRRTTFDQQDSENLNSLQLSWLHRTLTLYNSLYSPTASMTIKKYFIVEKQEHPSKKKSVPKKESKLQPRRKLRNVWMWHQGDLTSASRAEKHTAEVVDSLPDLSCKPRLAEILNSNTIWSHVADCIDLMLPRCLSQKGDVATDVAMKTAIIRVKRALQSRYPVLMDVMFEEALPYALWARGQVQRAAESFLRLSEQADIEPVAYREAHLNEAGRMYAHFGEFALARKMYLTAAELGCHGNQGMLQQQLCGQSMMLVAHLEDMGVFSPDKAVAAGKAWQAVTRLNAAPKLAEDAACVSLLCFQAGHYPVATLLKEAVERLESWSPHLSVYLSMVHALRGDVKRSIEAYRKFVNKNGVYDPQSLPGYDTTLSRSGQREYTPWKSLVTAVTTSGLSIIPLLWRFQLCHPLFSHMADGKTTVSDYHSDNLNLHISQSGHLTGNLRMMLPPMRSINIHPFTGALVFPSVPLLSTVWREDRTEESTTPIQDHLQPPKRRRVFQNSKGQTVDILSSSKLNFEPEAAVAIQGGNQCFLLLWRCTSTNHTIKLDLRKAIRQKIRNETKRIIQEAGDGKKDKLLNLLEFCHVQGLYYNLQILNRVVDNQIRKEQKIDQFQRNVQLNRKSIKQERKASKGNYYKGCGLIKDMFQLQVSMHSVVNDCLVLHLTTYSPPDSSYTRTADGICVIVNCTEAGSFRHPLILLDPKNRDACHWSTVLPTPTPKGDPWVNKGDIIVLSKAQNYHPSRNIPTCIQVYSTEPGLLRELTLQNTDSTQDHGYMDFLLTAVVIGQKIYGIHPDKTRVVCSSLTQSTLSAGHYPGIVCVHVTGDRLMVTDDNGVSFVNKDSLQPVPIQLEQEGPLAVDGMSFYPFIVGKFKKVSVLKEKRLGDSTSERGEITRVAIALNSFLVLVEFDKWDRALVTVAMELPGRPKELHFVSEQVGFLVTTSIHQSYFAYTENMYHVTNKGRVLSILTCLGCGPRSFFSFYHHGTSSATEDQGNNQKGWFVYMRDGHGGICCFRL